MGQSKIDQELKLALKSLSDAERTDALIHPKYIGQEIENFLLTKKNEGLLDYNILKLANCIFVRATKDVLYKIADRDDVLHISVNPTFKTQT